MSIILNGLITKWLMALWPVPLLLVLFMVGMRGSMGSTSTTLTISLLACFSSATLVWLAILQKSVIRFHNIRDVLGTGYMVVATNNSDDLREIADAVSKYLSQLGIDHLGHKGYTKHLAYETPSNPFYRVPIEFVLSRASEKCKLILILYAKSCGQNGVSSLGYCLFDRGDKSVITITLHSRSFSEEWPTVRCDNKTTKQVAREIVGGLFERLHLVIRAGTAPAG